MGSFTAQDQSVAKVLVDTLLIPMKLMFSSLACREMDGEESCSVGWFVPAVSGGWPV